MSVVGFVNAHHGLHRLRGQSDLWAHHPSALGDALSDVDQLDLVGVDDIYRGCAAP